MDFCAVFIFLCLFTAQAASRAAENVQCTGALRPSLQLMRERTGELLGKITKSEFPNTSCPPMTRELSSFCCKMMELSKLIPKLEEDLLTISQLSLQVEKSFGGPTPSQDCSLPHFEQQMEIDLYLKCLLQSLDQQLSELCSIY